MIEFLLQWLVLGGGSVAFLYLLGRQLLSDYFKQKRNFVDELVQRQKADRNGEGTA